jgi:hypothetical protein
MAGKLNDPSLQPRMRIGSPAAKGDEELNRWMVANGWAGARFALGIESVGRRAL